MISEILQGTSPCIDVLYFVTVVKSIILEEEINSAIL